MNLSVFGLGYVGAVSLACLARDGHRVTGVDIDPNKLAALREGRSPVVEAGLDALIGAGREAGCIEVTDQAGAAVRDSELSFVCVGTPAAANGSQSDAAVRRVCAEIGAAIAAKGAWHGVVVRSTLAPGALEAVVAPALEAASGGRVGRDFALAFQPEFLREGSAVHDYDHPPFTVVGCEDRRLSDRLEALFGHLPGEFIRTDPGTAQLLKYACNAFHALKVTFANEIGRLGQALDADPQRVMALLCRDRSLNISPAYLRPGFAFGGSCLPKDLRALLYLAKTRDVELPMLAGVLESNGRHVEHVFDRILANGRGRVTLIGLSFKEGTDDLRESPLVELAERCIGKGLDLAIYDPQVEWSRLIGANRRYIEAHIPHVARLLTGDLDAAVERADVVVVGRSDPAVTDLLARRLRPEQRLIDLVGLPEALRALPGYGGACW